MTTTQNKSSTATNTQLRLAICCPVPGTAAVAVAGEVDIATAPTLYAALLDALNSHTPVVLDVDLSACTFLDCSGIRVLLAAHATAQTRGCHMWIRHPRRLVRLVLEVTGLLSRFTAPYDPTAVPAANQTGTQTQPSRSTAAGEAAFDDGRRLTCRPMHASRAAKQNIGRASAETPVTAASHGVASTGESTRRNWCG
ncbi:MAG TPA: STAS domain-containing protein [Candidatus Limnocylindrales bacterium]